MILLATVDFVNDSFSSASLSVYSISYNASKRLSIPLSILAPQAPCSTVDLVKRRFLVGDSPTKTNYYPDKLAAPYVVLVYARVP
jgi:hypothetical protein